MELGEDFLCQSCQTACDISDYDLVSTLFLENLPEDSWDERNDKSVEFKNMEDANIR